MKKILIITPTLGRSHYWERLIRSLDSLDLGILHVCVGPLGYGLNSCNKNVERIFLNDRGGGMYAALNQGLEFALMREDWDWFTYVNDDDELIVTDPSIFDGAGGCVYGDGIAIDPNSKVLFQIPVSRTPSDLLALFVSGVVGIVQQGWFINRAVVDRFGLFDSSFKYTGDLDYMMRLLEAGVEFKYEKSIRGYFRITPFQLSKNGRCMADEASIIRDRVCFPLSRCSAALIRFRFRMQNLNLYFYRFARFGFRRVKNIYEA